MPDFRQFIDFHILGKHRLENVKMLPLGSTIDQAIQFYGESIQVCPCETTPEVTEYIFSASPYHQVAAFEWKDKVQSILYCSAKADPTRDLRWMFDRYRDDSEWNALTSGYLYQREDGKLRIWCSAIPIIGVAYADYLSAEAKMKAAHELKELDQLDDITWVPAKVVSELQRHFIEGRSTKLNDLASRSDRIAVSPDGREVFIVAQCRVYEDEEGVGVMITQPHEDEESTQVIRCYFRSENGSSWPSIPLPRNAHVDYLRFEAGQWRLQIRRTTDNRVFRFHDSATFGRNFFRVSPFREAELWQELESAAESSTPSTE